MAATAQGARAAAPTSAAASRWSGPAGDRPAAAISTLPAPMMSTGTYSGSTSSESRKPAPRSPRVSAAPMAPIMLSTGVPRSNDRANTAYSD